MTKRNISFFIGLHIVFVVFWSCDGMGTLFHGSKPEEAVPSFTIAFDANGATGAAPSPQTVNSGTVITMPAEGGLSRGGDVFTGWNISKSGGGTSYPPESPYTVTANQTFYAQWTDPAQIYTVTYHANGAAGTAPGAQKVPQGGSISVAGKGNLTNGNKTFDGWNTQADGLGDGYQAGVTLVVSTNTTLYAQWTDPAQTYTVTYHANGASGTPPTQQTALKNGNITAAGKGNLTNGSKTFDGWNTQADGSGDRYNAGATLVVTTDTTLYAQWAALPVPAGLSVTGQTADSISLSWQQVPGATGYKAYKGSSSGMVNEYVADTAAASYTVTGLAANTSYYFAVSAVNADGESSLSTAVQGTTAAITLQPPGSLSVGGQTSNSLTLSWNPVSNADGYRISRSTGSANSYSQIDTTASTSYNDTKLAPSTTYHYRVTAYAGQAESSAAETSGTTTADGGIIPFPPAKPTGLVVSGSSPGSVSLSWNSVTNANSYDVYRANTKTGALSRIGSGITGTSWADSTVSGGVMYYYTVRGVNTSGSSPDSNMAFACAASHYALPNHSSSQTTNLYPKVKAYYRLAVSAGDRITITWQDGNNQNASSYIYVSAWQNDGTEIFRSVRNGYTSPREFTVTEAGYVTVEVNNDSGSTGYDYQIYYSF